MKKFTTITVIAGFLGVLLALQFRAYQKVESFVLRSQPQNILAELRVFQLANQELRAHLQAEEKSLEEVFSKINNASLENEIQHLKLLSGEEAVAGEGIEITLNEPVEDFWISDLTAQLASAGAEAVALNDVRLTMGTAGFRDITGGFILGHLFLRPPLRVTVIGPKQQLHQAIAQNGGIIDRMEHTHPNLQILLSQREKIIIPAIAR